MQSERREGSRALRWRRKETPTGTGLKHRREFCPRGRATSASSLPPLLHAERSQKAASVMRGTK
ncbi:hypothetical protein EYF80_045626 [Liparis tanakae]|uniref:Uncharacterized protein n=1 Tax=Liparis tanakae TaxID=230148 RepID=A0A4Z2FT40_9TELE|nr:hypothetical protein EYF80_045626 [Liparis tanakae]